MLSSLTRKPSHVARLAVAQARGLFYSQGQPYDKRWQNTLNFAYFADPQEDDPVGKPRPEDSQEYGAFLGSFRAQFRRRFSNALRLPWERRHRLYSPFDLWFLPTYSLFMLQFWPLGLGFKGLALVPLGTLFCRIKDKSMDPIFPETYLRDMIQHHPQLKKHFAVETMTTLDFEFEWMRGFQDPAEFPEFQNKLFRGLTRLLQHRHEHVQGPLRVRGRAVQGDDARGLPDDARARRLQVPDERRLLHVRRGRRRQQGRRPREGRPGRPPEDPQTGAALPADALKAV